MSDQSTSSIVRTDICVIGAGAGGLSVASTAALLGVPVVLVERGRMGGDCLSTGCIPSKALIASAHAAHMGKHAAGLGIGYRAPVLDAGRIRDHIRGVIGDIAPMDSTARYRALGVDVIEGEAAFIDGRTVAVGEQRITARRFVIATGGEVALPPVEGLADVPYLTHETVFDLPEIPKRLVILGGGPVGVELAQAFRRLGSEVTIVEAGTILSREDPETVDLMRRVLARERVQVLEGTMATKVAAISSGMTLDLSGEGAPKLLNCSHLLVATGRKPRFNGLGLDKAGVAVSAAGIVVDRALRTSNRRIYAVGDCAGGPQFTHVAAYQAGLVIKNALFRLPVKVNYDLCPRVMYGDPEIAAIGLSEAEARARDSSIRTLRWPFSENDRARTANQNDGFVKVIVDRKERILGVTIAGPQAGELIAPWALAMRNGLRLEAMIDLVLPYPTLSEVSRRAAMQSLAPKLRSPWIGRILRFLRMFG